MSPVPPDRRCCDVAIVGYGPTGATAANLLGGLGHSVVVVERDPELYARARAVSTDEEVVRVWQRTGLADRLLRDMVPGGFVDFVDARGRPFFRAELPPRGHGHPAQLFLHQPALERVLRAGVARYPQVTVLLGRACVDVRQDPGGVDLVLDDGRTVRARYVVAADGAASPVRSRLGVAFAGRTFPDPWVVVDAVVRAPWPGSDRMRFHGDPARPAVDCPIPLSHHRWEYPVLPGEDEGALAGDAAVRAFLQRRGVPGDAVEVERAVVYRHQVRVAARWRVGRVLLAGDAAHVMPPWIGQGMAAGVRDAGNLCWKLAGVLDGSLPEAVLDSYEAERRPHVREVARRAVFAGRIITERRRPAAAVRDPLLRAVSRVGPLRRGVQARGWVPPARIRRGFLARGRHPAVGHLPPQPWVFDGHGRRRRLDDALRDAAGPGWVVVHAPGHGSAEVPCPVAAPRVELRPAGAPTGPGAVVEIGDVLTAWLRARRAVVLALRPDGVVHAAA